MPSLGFLCFNLSTPKFLQTILLVSFIAFQTVNLYGVKSKIFLTNGIQLHVVLVLFKIFLGWFQKLLTTLCLTWSDGLGRPDYFPCFTEHPVSTKHLCHFSTVDLLRGSLAYLVWWWHWAVVAVYKHTFRTLGSSECSHLFANCRYHLLQCN